MQGDIAEKVAKKIIYLDYYKRRYKNNLNKRENLLIIFIFMITLDFTGQRSLTGKWVGARPCILLKKWKVHFIDHISLCHCGRLCLMALLKKCSPYGK